MLPEDQCAGDSRVDRAGHEHDRPDATPGSRMGVAMLAAPCMTVATITLYRAGSATYPITTASGMTHQAKAKNAP